MRQLESALTLLADRAEPLPIEALVERLITQLAAEGVVTEPARGADPILSMGSPAPPARSEPTVVRRSRWRPLATIGAATAVVVIAATATVLLFGQHRGNDVIQPGPTTTIPTLLSTPWEQFRDENPDWDIPSVISDEEVFIAAYNAASEAYRSCEQAYGGAKTGYDGYHRILEEWDDEVSELPGLDYDRFVGELVASNEWLIEHQCPGRGDFISVG